MADRTKIEWTDATVNAVNGCSVLSPGCTNCYAMKLAGTRLRHHPSRAGLTVDSKAGPVWSGEVRLNEKALMEPLRWARPRRIFWNAHGDLFHENVPDEWIDRCFAVMALTPQHVHQVLTKRPERMWEYVAGRASKLARFMVDEYLIRGTKDAKRTGRAINVSWPVQSVGDIDAPGDITMRQWPLPNVWLGVSVEDQKRADERIPYLLTTPAAVRLLSCEPLLGPVRIRDHWLIHHHPGDAAIDWVIVGGESGPGARPMHPDWARSLRDQCAAAGVPFFFKQWGEWIPCHAEGELAGTFLSRRSDGSNRLASHDKQLRLMDGVEFRRVGKADAGRLLDGVEHNGMPGQ